jgi:predicted DNA-binding transcriptional regulator AlpA
MVGKTRRAVYADISRGKWPYVKLGRRVYFRSSALEKLIAAHERPAFEAPSPDGRGR